MTEEKIVTQSSAGFLGPILKVLLGSSGKVDVGEIIKAMQSFDGANLEITPRSLYELVDGAILDRKIPSSPEAMAFLNLLRSEVLNKK